ncbi:hypothetical protein TEA_023556 [Camellia sinensis var. sinensis]|uniref:Uncharacterized protein n=1 Tax=Camellia sinensis var. sinensis TaxID=542762 RepID=A0A4S4D5B4_CAMSN|nr:hypothetical protein TEA_023556 [Camellia sinensis var. sinensis]
MDFLQTFDIQIVSVADALFAIVVTAAFFFSSKKPKASECLRPVTPVGWRRSCSSLQTQLAPSVGNVCKRPTKEIASMVLTPTHRRLLGKATKLLSGAISHIRLLGICSTFLGISTSHLIGTTQLDISATQSWRRISSLDLYNIHVRGYFMVSQLAPSVGNVCKRPRKEIANMVLTPTHRRLLGKATKLLSGAISHIRLLGICSTFLGISTTHPSCPSVQHNSISLQPSRGCVTCRIYSACPRVNLHTTRKPFHTKRLFNHDLRPFINSSLEDNLLNYNAKNQLLRPAKVSPTPFTYPISLSSKWVYIFLHASKNLVAYQ